MTEYSYSLIHKPEDNPGTDITQWVDRIDAVEVGSGEVRNAKIRLNAMDGRNLTRMIDISWTGGAGNLAVGDIVQSSDPNDGWKGTLIEIMDGDHYNGKGRFAENAETFVDTAKHIRKLNGSWRAIYTVGSDELQNRPFIDQFDKLKLNITDRNGDTYDAIYEVDQLKPVQNSQIGLALEVNALGMEWHQQKTQFSKPWFEESGYQVSKQLIDIYNDPDVTTPEQPNVIGHDQVFGGNDYGNNLPKYTANVYPFNLREQSIYQALIWTMDKMGSSVASGGAGDFFEVGYADDLTDTSYNTLKYRGFISGSPPDQTSIPTIRDTEGINPGEEEGGIEATAGYVQGTWGGDGIGTLPFKNGLFQGALEIWNLLPAHDPSVSYPKDVIVTIPNTQDNQGDLIHYKSNKATGTQPPSADWDQYYFDSFLAQEVGIPGQYSQWTNLLYREWQNCFARPDGTLQDDPATPYSVRAWDHNLVVTDGTYSRTWVDVRTYDPALIESQYKYSDGTFPRGFRVLVDSSLGTPAGAFAGHDDEVIQYTVNGAWRTFRTPSQGMMVAVDNSGLCFQYDTGVWKTLDGAEEVDCYHPIYDIKNVQGFNDKPNGGGSNFGRFSGVQVESKYGLDDNPISPTNRKGGNYYRQGAWINFRFPWPPNTFNGVFKIGYLYGNPDNTGHEPNTLDAGNMHLNSDGQIGFNNDNAMDLGALDSLRFKTNFRWWHGKSGTFLPVRSGNFKCRCVAYDTSDNVVIQDFIIAFNGQWTQTIDLPLSDFKIYRGRKPWSFEDAGSNIFLEQLEILNVFEWKNIQKIGFVWLAPYDDEGRYQPWGQVLDILPTIESYFPTRLLEGFNILWTIDAMEFSKVGLALSEPVKTGRALMLPFDHQPQIQNNFQLKQHNDALLEIARFRKIRYDIVTEGTCKERFGDSIYLQNSELVRDSNRNESEDGANDGDPNTIKLVCKRIRYEITKPANGPGGFLRYIEGVKRFV
jgi:hypothetical protein